MSASALMNTTKRLPVQFARGEGVWIWDTDGRRYLDAIAGLAVNGLGHAHPGLTSALHRQIDQLIHVSNLFVIPEQEALAEALAQRSGMTEVFFGNSGCEANECALKLARLHARARAVAEPCVLVMEGAFHGRTLATMAATSSAKVRQGFEPAVEGFVRIPYGDIEAAARAGDVCPNVVAVLVEVVQGEGGVRLAEPPYLRALRELCTARDWLLMIDEVQTGVGRTGAWFAHQLAGIMPDVMTLAKGLGSGVPIGACLAVGPAAGLMRPGMHGSTFGGNPLACTAGLATIKAIESEKLIDNSAAMGARLVDGLRDALAGLPGIRDIRGAGLMIGVELQEPCGELVNQALAEGLLINVTAERVVRLLPALTISPAETDLVVQKLGRLIRSFLARTASLAEPA